MSTKEFIRVPIKNVITVQSLYTIYSFELAPSFRSKGESHDFWEIVYVDKGEVLCQTEETTQRLTQGEMIFHAPNEFHVLACDSTHSAGVFILTFDCHSAAMRYFEKKKITVSGELREILNELIEECKTTFYFSTYPLETLPDAPIGGHQLIRLLLESFLIRLLRSEEHKQPSVRLITSQTHFENELVKEIHQYLADHVREHVSLEELSKRFHFGKTHLCALFKKSTGTGIIQHHLTLKMTEAKRLLRESHRTVTEISEYLGFDNAAYFSRLFRKHTGISPLRFRNTLIYKNKD